MKIITDLRCTEYHRFNHPERPQRVKDSVEHLKRQKQLPVAWGIPQTVADTSILKAHEEELLQYLSLGEDLDMDTPYHPGIADHARRSVGAALQAVHEAKDGHLAFSLIRPPGHHATPNRAMGFCYLNNIAIAALEAQELGFPRVAVLDFDVHHGNGTEEILLDRKGLAYYSVHQYPCYPGTGRAHLGPNSFNYPVPPDSAVETYRAACTEALAAIRKFKPDLLGISAGFDCYRGDPLGQQNMEVEDFHWLGRQIHDLKIPSFGVLEGGYSKALPDLIHSFLAGWAGQDPIKLEPPKEP